MERKLFEFNSLRSDYESVMKILKDYAERKLLSIGDNYPGRHNEDNLIHYEIYCSEYIRILLIDELNEDWLIYEP